MSSAACWRGTAACAAILLTAFGCDAQTATLSKHQAAVVQAWLTCDECVNGEREAVRSLGTNAVSFLRSSLLAAPDSEVQNMRAQYSRLYRMLPPPRGDSAEFVNRYMGTLHAAIDRRAAISLGDLRATSVLEEVTDSVTRTGDLSLAAFIRGQMLRSGPSVAIASGPATTWTVVEPSSHVVLCNGVGNIPTKAPEATEIAARATGPSGSFAPPWQHVYFYGRPIHSSEPPELLAVVDARGMLITDSGVGRQYTWRSTSGVHGWPAGIVELFAVGVDASGSAYRTPSDTLVEVIAGSPGERLNILRSIPLIPFRPGGSAPATLRPGSPTEALAAAVAYPRSDRSDRRGRGGTIRGPSPVPPCACRHGCP